MTDRQLETVADARDVLSVLPAAARSEMPSRLFDPQVLRPRLLRGPVGPYLLLGDLAVFAVTALVSGVFAPVQAVALAAVVTCFWVFGMYRSRLSLSLLDDLPFLVAGGLVCLTTELSLSTLFMQPRPRWDALEQSLVLFLGVLVVRRIAYSVVRRARSSGLVRHAALVLGAGHVGARLVGDLQEHRQYGVDPVGFVDSFPRLDPDVLPAPLLGGYGELSELIEDFAVRVVIVGFGNQREADLVDILRTCDRLDCEIFIVPRLFEVHSVTRDMDEVWGIPLVRVRRAPFRSFTWQVKRLVDLVLSGAALFLLAPVLAACAVAVRWEGGPGIIFRQVRVGLDGTPFELLKFRSLKPVDDTESATNWNIKHDDRLGPVGRFLRRSSLDELPQLWNILRGDMSLVGPRPERPHFVDEFTSRVPRYMSRHRVPAGLTGWAQVHGLRGDTSIEDRASFDNHYIENWSLWGDVKIMVRTVTQVVGARGG
ncbi:exopolysaccharide biosynthesis polyprenyl glycosylphosphotransferase [Kineococcus sp. R8]|uniref:sugar transferase n=1 Tax=Kineococcus siccus TaxID=2696567 RepID=UPI001411B990|nr:sugar transferase [Kineococcus siccus]NAZ81109.1 exopolysaccharide biosynthesis polyprenyl glycosylphosphotransferase [Kineococcus siccus]